MNLPRRGARAAIILTAFLLLAAPSAPVLQRAEDIAVAARPIPRFDTSPAAGKRFGGLDYVGGFSYTSRSPFLEGVSSIRMLKGDRFLAVTDTGLWFAGRIERDEKGAPVGMSEAHLSPILGPGGQPPRRKGEADAEGLGIDNNGDALVSFEINHRIAVYRDALNPFASTPRFLPLPIPRKELRFNAGLETIATAPANSPLKGRTITVSEASVDENGDLFAGILGPGGGVFKIRRDPIWSATDGAFLPDGDFLLLERRFQGYTRVGMRIRRIDGRSIRPGAVVDGPVLMEATLAQEIDNMEGLDTYRAPDGSIRLVLVSDDNSSFFQRNLFLEFKLVENAAAAIQ
ncbi:esterase-like activity of phytase family protein [Aureimonas psammosilenae]|uniref:esterase-like activity of phytase family protein n=1 Tax=Aureimonas psammosilenae TaxID=2495496 RepID=UPI0012606FC5|nr:esterase-like activity of phytase family protein [Aureimonas psammosilenae]